MCTRDRIDEVLRMIDGLMDVALRQICDVFGGRPLVAVDRGARSDELLDDGDESVSISLIDQHCKTFTSVAIDAAEDPLIRHLTSSIVLAFRPG